MESRRKRLGSRIVFAIFSILFNRLEPRVKGLLTSVVYAMKMIVCQRRSWSFFELIRCEGLAHITGSSQLNCFENFKLARDWHFEKCSLSFPLLVHDLIFSSLLESRLPFCPDPSEKTDENPASANAHWHPAVSSIRAPIRR
jgi:hypothetical protein